MLRYIPIVAYIVLMYVFTPTHAPEGVIANTMHGVLMGVTIVVGFTLTTYLSTTNGHWVVMLALLPVDMLFTHISYLKHGNWAFEANAWIAHHGSVWPAAIFTLSILIVCLPIYHTWTGRKVAFMLCMFRMVAVCSHPIMWLYQG